MQTQTQTQKKKNQHFLWFLRNAIEFSKKCERTKDYVTLLCTPNALSMCAEYLLQKKQLVEHIVQCGK